MDVAIKLIIHISASMPQKETRDLTRSVETREDHVFFTYPPRTLGFCESQHEEW